MADSLTPVGIAGFFCLSLALPLAGCSTTPQRTASDNLPTVIPVDAFALDKDAEESAEGMTSYFFSRTQGPDDHDNFHEAFATPTTMSVPLFPDEEGSIEDAIGIAQPKLNSFRVVSDSSVIRDHKSLTAPGVKKLRRGQRVVGTLEGDWLRIGNTRYVIHAESLAPLQNLPTVPASDPSRTAANEQ